MTQNKSTKLRKWKNNVGIIWKYMPIYQIETKPITLEIASYSFSTLREGQPIKVEHVPNQAR